MDVPPPVSHVSAYVLAFSNNPYELAYSYAVESLSAMTVTESPNAPFAMDVTVEGTVTDFITSSVNAPSPIATTGRPSMLSGMMMSGVGLYMPVTVAPVLSASVVYA